MVVLDLGRVVVVVVLNLGRVVVVVVVVFVVVLKISPVFVIYDTWPIKKSIYSANYQRSISIQTLITFEDSIGW